MMERGARAFLSRFQVRSERETRRRKVSVLTDGLAIASGSKP
jgi:hypothetical protein